MIIERPQLLDSRGSFRRLFCARELPDAFGESGPVQLNHSFTTVMGTVRGMHFQRVPDAEVKLVSCVAGAVFDVAVDLRAGSPTFLRWYGTRLDGENNRSLLIPRGFAHGFQSLTDNCQMVYAHSTYYVLPSEAAINPFDPAVAIDWPLSVSSISDRDQSHPCIDDEFGGVAL